MSQLFEEIPELEVQSDNFFNEKIHYFRTLMCVEKRNWKTRPRRIVLVDFFSESGIPFVLSLTCLSLWLCNVYRSNDEKFYFSTTPDEQTERKKKQVETSAYRQTSENERVIVERVGLHRALKRYQEYGKSSRILENTSRHVWLLTLRDSVKARRQKPPLVASRRALLSGHPFAWINIGVCLYHSSIFHSTASFLLTSVTNSVVCMHNAIVLYVRKRVA